MYHAPGLNGPWYWKWDWRHINARKLFPGMFIAFLPFLIAQYLYKSGNRSIAMPLGLVMLSTFALQLVAVAMQTDPFNLTANIVYNVANPNITGYFTDAMKYTNLREFLGSYHLVLPSLNVHSLTKPPGLILFYVPFIRIFGYTPTAALLSGIVIGILSIFSVLTTFFLVTKLSGSREAGFDGASFLGLCPGLVLFFPEFDQVYPVLSCALLISWIETLDKNQVRYSLAFGLLLSLVCFVSYSLLVTGIFLTLYSVYVLLDDHWANSKKLAIHAGISAAIVVGVYTAIWIFAGYNPIATFLAALENQAQLIQKLGRQNLYPETILFDLTDFALGSGWISFLLAFYFIIGKLTAGVDGHGREFWFTVLIFIQIFGVAVSGLLAVETARVWLFMLPLLMLPVGLELNKWNFPSRIAVYVGLWFLTTVICQNMWFAQ